MTPAEMQVAADRARLFSGKCAACACSAAALAQRAEHGPGSFQHVTALQAWARWRTEDGRTIHASECPERHEFSLVFGFEVRLPQPST